MSEPRCPAITERAWRGHVFQCELPAGHDGLHKNTETPMAYEWDYDDARYLEAEDTE